MVIANAGVDHSNVPGAEEGERVLLLPQDPDASSAALRDALQERFGVSFAVVVSDSVGRAWRNGVVGLALGAAGCRRCSTCAAGPISKAVHSWSLRSASPTRSPRRRSC